MIIAIDVGGTKISAALISSRCSTENPKPNTAIINYQGSQYHIIEQRKINSVIHTDLSNLSLCLFELCQDWISQAERVAVACTGQVGDEKVNFLSVKQSLPLKKQLNDKFNLPISIINDAAAAAWAEYCFLKTAKQSISKTDRTLVYITVSTGIGGGIIQNGQLVTSDDGFCAHLGHVSVQHNADKKIHCHCGRINCAESIASGTAIAKQASLLLGKKVSCKQVFEQYLTVPAIAKCIDDASSAVCDLIASVKALTGTKVVILGGSVGSADTFHQQVIEKVSKLPVIYQVNIELPQMGANADLIGASLYSINSEP